MRARLFAAIAVLSVLFIQPAPLIAQGITASISGVVGDATGGVLSGAKVTATRLETNEDRIATTNDSGEFIVPLLQPGRYRVTIELASFKTFQQELKRRIDLWTDERLRAVQDAESGYGTAPDHAGSTSGGKDRQALQVLDNKDDYAKALSDWTDLHVKRLDETEEVHKKNEDRQATTQVAATQKAEHDRSRARVREIHDYVQLSEDRMRRWEALLDATA